MRLLGRGFLVAGWASALAPRLRLDTVVAGGGEGDEDAGGFAGGFDDEDEEEEEAVLKTAPAAAAMGSLVRLMRSESVVAGLWSACSNVLSCASN